MRVPVEVRHRLRWRTLGILEHDSWAAALMANHAATVYERYRPAAEWTVFFAEMERTRDALLRSCGRSRADRPDGPRLLVSPDPFGGLRSPSRSPPGSCRIGSGDPMPSSGERRPVVSHQSPSPTYRARCGTGARGSHRGPHDRRSSPAGIDGEPSNDESDMSDQREEVTAISDDT